MADLFHPWTKHVLRKSDLLIQLKNEVVSSERLDCRQILTVWVTASVHHSFTFVDWKSKGRLMFAMTCKFITKRYIYIYIMLFLFLSFYWKTKNKTTNQIQTRSLRRRGLFNCDYQQWHSPNFFLPFVFYMFVYLSLC